MAGRADHWTVAPVPHRISSLGLVTGGLLATAGGGIGVAFRAAGFGYLGQSVLALVAGMVLIRVGLRLAADGRRVVLADRTPARVAAWYEPTMVTVVARVRTPETQLRQLAPVPVRPTHF